MKHPMLKILRILALAAMVVLAAACTPGTVKKGGKSAAVEDRAVQRWEDLIAKRAADAYEYLTPGYRKTHPKDVYALAMANRPVKWKTVNYMRKECEDDNTCTVFIYLVYELRISAGIPGPVEGVSIEKEKWLRIKGVWYHLPDK